MKKVLFRMLVILIIVGFVSSCASYTCPTYSKYEDKQENFEDVYAQRAGDLDNLDTSM